MPFDVQGKIGQRAIAGAQHALIKARGDGNCLFHAAGHELLRRGLVLPAHDTHQTFRAHVVAYVRAHAKDTTAEGFKLRDGLGISHNAQGAVTPAQGRQIDQRVAYLDRVNNWGDEACITAIEQLYNVQVLVYDNQGRDQNDLGVAHYTPFRGPGNELRLCVQYIGAVPYHYDLWLPDALYDPARDGPDRTAPEPEPEPSKSEPKPKSEPRKVSPPKGPPPKEWDYAFHPDGLKPYGAPISHQRFAYTAAWLDGKGGSSKAKKGLSVALGDQQNSSLGPPAPVVAVQLVNKSKAKDLESRSWSAAQGKEAFAVGHRERFFMPLQRRDGVCVDIADPSTTELVIDVEDGKARQPAIVYGAFFQRSLGKRGDKSQDGAVADFELDLSKVKGEKVEGSGSGGARVRYTIPAATVLDLKLRKFLVWEGAPYQLVVSSAEELSVEASAWTYFHVPSEWEVNTAEAVGGAQLLMLNDDLEPLVAAGIGARTQAVANLNLGSEKVTGRETFELSADAEAALGKLLEPAGLPLDLNGSNYLVEGEDGSHYVSTSWASMVHLSLNAEDGWYYMDALYCSGNLRRAFLASQANLAGTERRKAASAEYAKYMEPVKECRKHLENYCGALNKLRIELENAGEASRAYLSAEQQMKDELFKTGKLTHATKVGDVPKIVNKAMQERHPKLCKENDLVPAKRREAVSSYSPMCVKTRQTANQALLTFHGNEELRGFLGGEKIPCEVARDVPWDVDRVEHTWRQVTRIKDSVDDIFQELMRRRNRTALDGLELPVTATLDGVADFDTAGKPLTPEQVAWKQFLFKPPLKVSQAVTTGISSCAGGVTFSSEKTPEHIFLWHVDGNLSIPLRPELERLWPGGEGMPELRSVVSVCPTLWELNKYRPENLYPAGTLGRCRTVFLPRSCHLYGTHPMVAGGLRFGVDVSDGDLALVFTYDLEMRLEPLTKWRGAEPADLPGILVDFGDNLFGMYRDGGAKVDTPEAMGKYITAMTLEDRQARNDIKHRLRQHANKSCRVPALNADGFETLAGEATALLATDCFYAGEKGDQELSDDHNDRWATGSMG
jgi:hypothetical protein